MTVNDICKKINADLVCGNLDKEFCGVYVGDLLSRAMSRVESGNLWITIMSNINVVAVATLTEPAAVILAENIELSDDEINKARENDITVISSPLSAYEICAVISACTEKET